MKIPTNRATWTDMPNSWRAQGVAASASRRPKAWATARKPAATLTSPGAACAAPVGSGR